MKITKVRIKLKNRFSWSGKHGVCDHKHTLAREFALPITLIGSGKPLGNRKERYEKKKQHDKDNAQ